MWTELAIVAGMAAAAIPLTLMATRKSSSTTGRGPAASTGAGRGPGGRWADGDDDDDDDDGAGDRGGGDVDGIAGGQGRDAAEVYEGAVTLLLAAVLVAGLTIGAAAAAIAMMVI